MIPHSQLESGCRFASADSLERSYFLNGLENPKSKNAESEIVLQETQPIAFYSAFNLRFLFSRTGLSRKVIAFGAIARAGSRVEGSPVVVP